VDGVCLWCGCRKHSHQAFCQEPAFKTPAFPCVSGRRCVRRMVLWCGWCGSLRGFFVITLSALLSPLSALSLKSFAKHPHHPHQPSEKQGKTRTFGGVDGCEHPHHRHTKTSLIHTTLRYFPLGWQGVMRIVVWMATGVVWMDGSLKQNRRQKETEAT